MYIDGQQKVNRTNVKYRNSGKGNIKINDLIMHTYRGGGATDQKFWSSTTDYAYFDDFKVWTNCDNVGNNSGGNTNDDIVSVNSPSSVERGSTVPVTVNYSSSTNRDVVVLFQLDQSPWTTYVSQRKDVSAGSGTLTFNLPIPSNTPLADSKYQFQTYITTNNGGWSTRQDHLTKPNVDVVNGGSSGDGGTAQSPTKTFNIPGVVEAEDYDSGGQGVAYNDDDPINKGNQYRNDGVDIQNTTDSGGGRNVGWTANGEWLEYTIASTTSGNYDIAFRVASPKDGSKSITATLDGSNIGTVNIPNTSGWQTWQTVTLSNVSISGGSNKVLRLKINGGNFNLNKATFTAVSTGSGNDGASCSFGTPSSSALPGYDGITFNNVYVFGNGGPSQSNIKRFKIKWVPNTDGPYAFSINTNNGQPSSYIDLRNISNTDFNGGQPDVSISGSGFPGLDGEYWVTDDNGNFVMVAKNGNYTIYCSNSSNAPTCSSNKLAGFDKEKLKTNDILLFPNPVKNSLSITKLPKSEFKVVIYDIRGSIMVSKNIQKNNNRILEMNLESLNSGVYFLQVISEEGTKQSKFIKN